jgi:branched-chain amino acid aminotransferase
MNASKTIWMNGKMVPWESATVHVMAHALHYGSSVFEGMRCYATPAGRAIFRLQAHIRRLFDSAKVYRMEIPYSEQEICEASRQLIVENGLERAYVRPLVFFGTGTLGVVPYDKARLEVVVAAVEWGSYLGEEGLKNGIDVCVSSWHRTTSASNPVLSKAGGHYLNSQLIGGEALRNGYAEGIAVMANGMLSEGSAENLFLVRDGVVYTPPVSAAILGGITRDAVITLATALGIEVRQQDLPRDMLYLADEVFVTGTAAEVTPVRSVDRIQIGKGSRGPVTEAIQNAFFGLFDGRTSDIHGWLDYVETKQA